MIFEDRLRKGDRLEPKADLWDTSDFDTKPLPFTCVLWRPGNESLDKHRCPLMDEAIGITIQTLMIDVLHTLYLHGVYARFLRRIVHGAVAGRRPARGWCADGRCDAEAGHYTAQDRFVFVAPDHVGAKGHLQAPGLESEYAWSAADS